MHLDSVNKWVVGVDEAGRGPLAGPVAVGIICAPEEFDILAAFPGLNDSKKLSEKKRDALFSLLEERVVSGDVSYSVELKTADEIDSRGIAVVIREAVAEGVGRLLPNPEHGKVWLDGSLKAPAAYFQETVIKGDSLIPAIMLASIAAKVTRDRFMVNLHEKYPEYDFAKHKGYGTASHREALKTHGLCEIHRRTFIHLG